MRSTGEVMGIDKTFAGAYAKAAIAAGQKLPTTGKVFITMTDKYKPDIVEVARDLGNLGFGLVATGGWDTQHLSCCQGLYVSTQMFMLLQRGAQYSLCSRSSNAQTLQCLF